MKKKNNRQNMTPEERACFEEADMQKMVEKLFEPALVAIGMRGVLIMKETVKLAYAKGRKDSAPDFVCQPGTSVQYSVDDDKWHVRYAPEGYANPTTIKVK